MYISFKQFLKESEEIEQASIELLDKYLNTSHQEAYSKLLLRNHPLRETDVRRILKILKDNKLLEDISNNPALSIINFLLEHQKVNSKVFNQLFKYTKTEFNKAKSNTIETKLPSILNHIMANFPIDKK